MTAPCASCVHEKICRNRPIMDSLTISVNAALDRVAVTVDGEPCSMKDIPWLNMSKTTLRCKYYREDSSYKMAMQMARANMNSVNPYTPPCM